MQMLHVAHPLFVVFTPFGHWCRVGMGSGVLLVRWLRQQTFDMQLTIPPPTPPLQCPPQLTSTIKQVIPKAWHFTPVVPHGTRLS